MDGTCITGHQRRFLVFITLRDVASYIRRNSRRASDADPLLFHRSTISNSEKSKSARTISLRFDSSSRDQSWYAMLSTSLALNSVGEKSAAWRARHETRGAI